MDLLERLKNSNAENVVASALDVWAGLTGDERHDVFHYLSRTDAEELFLNLDGHSQAELIAEKPNLEKRSWLRLLPPDDAADIIQELPNEERDNLLSLLDPQSRIEVSALLAYSEDNAGGLMNSRFARLRPDMEVESALRYLRMQAREKGSMIYYAYVLDPHQKLLGVVSFRQLFTATPDKVIKDIMETEIVKIPVDMDQERVSKLISDHAYIALPVVDDDDRMVGIVTVDDIVDVVHEEATEDIQKFGGVEALDAPYFDVPFLQMIKKRAWWLVILFFGEMLTATAMGHFRHEIDRAVVLALFIPLIISSGGNSGSQASTLIIRAMALGEVRIRDWWRVLLKEFSSGIIFGLILGMIGLCRIYFWPSRLEVYGEHYAIIAVAVGVSLVGVVLWGVISGAMLPFLLKRFGLDPASASAPLVATVVDVTGLIIYFSVASIILGGSLL